MGIASAKFRLTKEGAPLMLARPFFACLAQDPLPPRILGARHRESVPIGGNAAYCSFQMPNSSRFQPALSTGVGVLPGMRSSVFTATCNWSAASLSLAA